MNRFLLSDHVTTLDSKNVVIVPKQFREKFGLAKATRVVLARMSENCVSIWVEKAWRDYIGARLKQVFSSPGGSVSIESVRWLCHFCDTQELSLQDRGRIVLKSFSDVAGKVEIRGRSQLGVTIVDCNIFIELWRPSALDAFRKDIAQRSVDFWNAIDRVGQDVRPDPA